MVSQPLMEAVREQGGLATTWYPVLTSVPHSFWIFLPRDHTEHSNRLLGENNTVNLLLWAQIMRTVDRSIWHVTIPFELLFCGHAIHET